MNEQRDFNPYAPPKARLNPVQPVEPETPPGEWSPTPYRVPAVNGLMWLWQAGRLFVQRPIFWTLVLGVIVEVNFLWGIQQLRPSLKVDAGIMFIRLEDCLWLLLCGGAAILAHRQCEGAANPPANGPAGFWRRFRQMTDLPLIEPASTLLYGAAAMPGLFAAGCWLALQTGVPVLESIAAVSAKAFPREHPLVELMIFCPAWLILFLVYLLVPPLVALAGANLPQAVWRCLRALWRNWRALLSCGLLPMLVALLAFRGFLADTGSVLSGSDRILLNSLNTGMHAVLPLVGYAAVRDMFYHEE